MGRIGSQALPALALTVTLVAAGLSLTTAYRCRSFGQGAGWDSRLGALVNPGGDWWFAILGAQLNVPPQTFDRPSRSGGPGRVVPCPIARCSRVVLEADGPSSLVPWSWCCHCCLTLCGRQWRPSPCFGTAITGHAPRTGSGRRQRGTSRLRTSACGVPARTGHPGTLPTPPICLNVPERVEAG